MGQKAIQTAPATPMSLEVDRERRLLAMGQMAASLAHEIRNPLGSMELFLGALKKDLEAQPNALKLAEQIHLGIKTLDRVVSNCLQFAREITPQRKTVGDITPLFGQVLEYIKPKASAAGVHVEVKIDVTGPVEIDTYFLGQALLNLSLNAVEAVESRLRKDKAAPNVVEIESQLLPASWQITIRDSGVGIPAENQERMFDPFFTTKEKGTGLGLAITHAIVTAHNGTIEVVTGDGTKLGIGTEITLRIPQGSVTAKGSESHLQKLNTEGCDAR